MRTIRRSEERGHDDRGWLDARHSFSFSDYYDPRWSGFGALRVLNEDRVVPTAGFPPHAHRDMEIITYVLSGTLKHRDSLGNCGLIHPGELQLMSAGTGIQHSEYNPSPCEALHLLQIWIEPAQRGLAPRYQQTALAVAPHPGFSLVAGPPDSAAPLRLAQDACLLIARPAAGRVLRQALDARRRYYLHLARGTIGVGNEVLQDGDALLLERESALDLSAMRNSELLLFELA